MDREAQRKRESWTVEVTSGSSVTFSSLVTVASGTQLRASSTAFVGGLTQTGGIYVPFAFHIFKKQRVP